MRALALEALAVLRSGRFDLPLTYRCDDVSIDVGDIVRVPLGKRNVLAFVVAPPQPIECDERVRFIEERVAVPRAFNEEGLGLARFIAERYVCSLGEALGAIVLANAVPRIIDVLERQVAFGDLAATAVPARLTAFIWNGMPESFTLDALLHHPEARRTGDRSALIRHVQALVRSGDLRRTRRSIEPKVRESAVDILELGTASVRGKKVEALVAMVSQRGWVPKSEATLAGFSSAVVKRAIATGALRESQRERTGERRDEIAASAIVPNAEQYDAIARIANARASNAFAELLLYGVTGSGKTLVYVEAIKDVVRAGQRAIVLVPEISLTPQTAARFEAAFGNRVAVLHSALSERERFDTWQACMRGDVDVVVGARSAVFAPLPDVALLIVDEAHETSYKQDRVPRYHAIAVARERMRRAGGVLVLGSATPSLESYEAAAQGKIARIDLTRRATDASLPHVEIVDLTREFAAGNRRIFSAALTAALAQRLERAEKSVLFVNRRGSAGFLLCRNCGFVPRCARCDVSLAAHRAEGLLRCHYCDRIEPLPDACPSCKQASLREFGVGTERVAQEVLHLFPAARVVRMDSDTTTRIGDHARLLATFGDDGDVLVGTQMVAKGLDFPTVTLVGVIAADIGLHVPDYAASERTFDLIMQVCGRSGRVRPGEAIVQTYAPTHPAIAFAAAHDYEGFAQGELADRRALGYPPFARQVFLGVVGREKQRVDEVAHEYAQLMTQTGLCEVLGPAPYPIARVNDHWRYRIALRTRTPRALRNAIRDALLPLARKERSTRLIVNVDP